MVWFWVEGWEIIPNGVSLEKHENDTIVYFTNLGKDIELITPSNTPRMRRPDFWMDGLAWEMKSPEQTKREVVERAFDKALRQSYNVVIDLRRAKGRDDIAIKHLQKCFSSSRRAKRLLIITKEQDLFGFKK